MSTITATDKTANLNEAQALATKHDSQAVVILRIQKDGTATATMWANSPEKNRGIDGWLRNFITNLPKNPFQTLFGWDKGGVPTPE